MPNNPRYHALVLAETKVRAASNYAALFPPGGRSDPLEQFLADRLGQAVGNIFRSERFPYSFDISNNFNFPPRGYPILCQISALFSSNRDCKIEIRF
jgi:hypothetical protein